MWFINIHAYQYTGKRFSGMGDINKRLQWSLTETKQQVIIVVNQVELEVIIS